MAKVIIIVGENKWELTEPQKWLLYNYLEDSITENVHFLQPQEPHLKYKEQDEDLMKLIKQNIELAIDTIGPKKERISVVAFKRKFFENYPHISYNDLNNKQIEDFINSQDDDISEEKLMDLFKDYLLSQGLADVQE